MIYVGIDPGRNCGWAMLDGNGDRIASGFWELKGKQWPVEYMGLVQGTLEWASRLGFYKVGFEHVTFHRSNGWREIYYGQKCILHALDVDEPVLVTPAKVKATGGSRVKYGLMHNALEHWNLGEDYPIDDNEADALWIAETVRLMDVEA